MASKEETCVFLDHSGEPKTAKVQMKYKKEAEIVKCEGPRVLPVLKILTVLLIVLWLLGLTVIREFQLNAIKNEINGLRLELNDLKNKFMGDDIMDQLTRFENEFRDEERAKTSWDNMVDEDDDDFLKDSLYGDSMEDDSSDFLGETMEARPKPKSQTEYDDDDDDTFDDDSSPDDEELTEENFQMKKVMRIPKEDIEDESEILNRSKREIVAETPDGVPIMDEPYSVARAKNQSRVLPQPENIVELLKREHNSKELFSGWDNSQRSSNGGNYKKKALKKYDEMDTSTVSSSQVFTRPSRVMMTSGERSRPLRKFHVVRRPMLRSGPGGEHEYAPTTVENKPKRRRKNRLEGRQRSAAMSKDIEMLEESSSKRLVAAHFDGDTSGYSVGGHEHFAGNGRLRHYHDVPYTAWSPASWVSDLGMSDEYLIQDGSISIHEPGLYFVYAQVYFHDAHDTNAYRVYRNNNGQDEALMQCTTMTHSPATMDKANTCYTAGLFMLNSGDLLTIKNLGSLRYSIMEKGMSFFGFFKLGSGDSKGMASRSPRSN